MLILLGCTAWTLTSKEGDEGDTAAAADTASPDSNAGGGTGAAESDATPPPPKVDILWVVDNSGSMAEEQNAVRAAANGWLAPFYTAGVDFHLGVTTTDMDTPHAGRLRPDDAATLYVDTSVSLAAGVESFAQRIGAGTTGSSTERGRDASAAVLDTHRAEDEGFARDDASLTLVFLSDETDQSTTPLADYSSWLSIYRTEVAVIAIVGPVGGCATAEEGTGYLDLATAYPGESFSICGDVDAAVAEAAGDVVGWSF